MPSVLLLRTVVLAENVLPESKTNFGGKAYLGSKSGKNGAIFTALSMPAGLYNQGDASQGGIVGSSSASPFGCSLAPNGYQTDGVKRARTRVLTDPEFRTEADAAWASASSSVGSGPQPASPARRRQPPSSPEAVELGGPGLWTRTAGPTLMASPASAADADEDDSVDYVSLEGQENCPPVGIHAPPVRADADRSPLRDLALAALDGDEESNLEEELSDYETLPYTWSGLGNEARRLEERIRTNVGSRYNFEIFCDLEDHC